MISATVAGFLFRGLLDLFDAVAFVDEDDLGHEEIDLILVEDGIGRDDAGRKRAPGQNFEVSG